MLWPPHLFTASKDNYVISFQSLREKLETLMSENRDLHLSLSPPPMSPLSPSSPPDTDSLLSSSANSSVLIEQLDQLQFDKEESLAKFEESQAKYEEMKVRDINLRMIDAILNNLPCFVPWLS